MKQPNNVKRKRRRWIVPLVIILILVIIRLILPIVILSYSNKTLAGLQGYKGHINDIDLSILRGAVAANGFYLDKIDTVTKKQIPFISFNRADASIDWKALFHGKIVANALLADPVIKFTKEKTDPSKVARDTVNFRKIIKNLMPLKINSFEVRNGSIAFHDPTSKPAVNISAENINIIARNLSNLEDTALLPASVKMNANIYDGTFDMNMKMDPMKKFPAFELNMEIKNVNLVKLNDFFKAYGKIDVNKGNLGLFAEMAAEDWKYVGYVKPVIKDLEIKGPQDRKDSFLNKLWKGVVSVATSVLKNPKKDQIATKIPISGQYDSKTSVAIWYSILSALQNAFIQALYPSIDFQINISTVKELQKKSDKSVRKQDIEKSGGKKDKNKKEEKKSSKK